MKCGKLNLEHCSMQLCRGVASDYEQEARDITESELAQANAVSNAQRNSDATQIVRDARTALAQQYTQANAAIANDRAVVVAEAHQAMAGRERDFQAALQLQKSEADGHLHQLRVRLSAADANIVQYDAK